MGRDEEFESRSEDVWRTGEVNRQQTSWKPSHLNCSRRRRWRRQSCRGFWATRLKKQVLFSEQTNRTWGCLSKLRRGRTEKVLEGQTHEDQGAEIGRIGEAVWTSCVWSCAAVILGLETETSRWQVVVTSGKKQESSSRNAKSGVKRSLNHISLKHGRLLLAARLLKVGATRSNWLRSRVNLSRRWKKINFGPFIFKSYDNKLAVSSWRTPFILLSRELFQAFILKSSNSSVNQFDFPAAFFPPIISQWIFNGLENNNKWSHDHLTNLRLQLWSVWTH